MRNNIIFYRYVVIIAEAQMIVLVYMNSKFYEGADVYVRRQHKEARFWFNASSEN